MTKFTKEQLQQIAEDGFIKHGEAKAMARQLLASMEQEPVYQVWDWHWYDAEKHIYDEAKARGEECRILYAAPQLPQPAVVDADDNFYSWFCREWEQYYQPNQYSTSAKQHLGAIAESAWFACRAAMLQGTHRDLSHPVDPQVAEYEKIMQQAVPDGCWCQTCRPVTMTNMRFIVCPECGNKRCPHANDHRNTCTGSNEPGQEGSAYPAAPRQEVHFKTTSDERLMKTPDITGETVKVIGSFNDDGFCHKHPDTPLLKHPYMQLMVYPPRPATYCPKCEPHIAEWEDRDKKLRKGKGV